MTVEFDPGYIEEPYLSLCRDYETAAYPPGDFRLEWGPIFHRGRLDGSARLLVIGQDPATHEDFARRILVGTAGHRVQGFMAKLGIAKSYVMLNTFVFSVASQSGGEQHKATASIVKYRNRWISAVLAPGAMQGVVAFGGLANDAWTRFTDSSLGAAHKALPFQHVLHPTWPESSSAASHGNVKTAIKTMLAQWNAAIAALRPALTPDVAASATPYGDDFAPSELPEIPARDLPAGMPEWTRGGDGWAKRVGATSSDKRRTLQVVVPPGIV
jgi:uracil-DNA glycosylase